MRRGDTPVRRKDLVRALSGGRVPGRSYGWDGVMVGRVLSGGRVLGVGFGWNGVMARRVLSGGGVAGVGFGRERVTVRQALSVGRLLRADFGECRVGAVGWVLSGGQLPDAGLAKDQFRAENRYLPGGRPASDPAGGVKKTPPSATAKPSTVDKSRTLLGPQNLGPAGRRWAG